MSSIRPSSHHIHLPAKRKDLPVRISHSWSEISGSSGRGGPPGLDGGPLSFEADRKVDFEKSKAAARSRLYS